MAIPDFQSAMLPILRLLADGEEHMSATYVSSIADAFGATAEERRILIPSGRQPLFVNRIAWAMTHLVKAGLVERTGRGRVRITDRGREALAANLSRIDAAYLKRSPLQQSKGRRLQSRPRHQMNSSTRVFKLYAKRLPRSCWNGSRALRPRSSSALLLTCSWRWVTAGRIKTRPRP